MEDYISYHSASGKKNHQYILICEDDHHFTEQYEKKAFMQSLQVAQTINAGILLGGISWFDFSLQISPSLFWVNNFNAMQFTVIFRDSYRKILNTEFKKGDAADSTISSLIEGTIVMYPFISVQKEFGYSDVTTENGEKLSSENIPHRLFISCYSQYTFPVIINQQTFP